MTPAIYVRVSTEEQKEEGFSIDAQIEAGKKYCELHNLSEPEIYNDAGYSAKDDNRPELQRLISDVRSRRINTIIVYRIDRLSRNLTDFFRIMEVLENNDVSFVSIMEYFDTSSASGRLMRGILAVLSAFYREQLAENTRLGVMQRIREGKWSNHAPTGYRNVKDGLEPDEKASMVKLAYKMRAEGKSQNEISKTTGIKRSTLPQLLSNPVYLGITYENKMIFVGENMEADNVRNLSGVHEGNHKALIDDATWNKVQKRQKFVKGTWRTHSKRHALSGLLFCGQCGSAVEAKMKSPGQTRYKCIRRCGITSKSTKLVESALVASFDVLKNDLTLIRSIKQELTRDLKRMKKGNGNQLKEINKELTKIKRKTRSLFDLYYENQIDKDQFGKENQALQERMKGLEAEKANLDFLEHEKENELLSFEEFMTRFRDHDYFADFWQTAEIEAKRNFLLETVERMFLSEEGLTVRLFSFPDYLVTWEDARQGGLLCCAARATDHKHPLIKIIAYPHLSQAK